MGAYRADWNRCSRVTTTLTNDALGRTTRQTLPDTRAIGFAHDARGNITGLTPPGRGEHGFGYDALDQLLRYAPPSVGGEGATAYQYNADRQLTRVARPDGLTIVPHYDAASGRLTALVTPEGSYGFTWLAGGRLETADAPDAPRLAYSWDGPLLRSVSAGATPGSNVGFSYDANFWLKQIVGGGATVSYGYDNDGLLISAAVGSSTLTLSRDSQNGLLQGTSIGSLSDSWRFNGFAEPTGYAAKYGATELWSASYGRDDLGRITSRHETTAGMSATDGYGYDRAGRLQTVTRDGTPVSRYGFDSNSNRTEHRIGAASALRGRTWPRRGRMVPRLGAAP